MSVTIRSMSAILTFEAQDFRFALEDDLDHPRDARFASALRAIRIEKQHPGL
jgi:hypothetical protein